MRRLPVHTPVVDAKLLPCAFMNIQNMLKRLLRSAMRSPQVRRAADQAVRQGLTELQRRVGQGGTAGQGSTVVAPPPSGKSESYTQVDSFEEPAAPPSQRATPDSDPQPGPASAPLPDRSSADPVNFTYAPAPNGHADPGEVVWAWVPYEEDPSKGKDRPVLIVADEGAVLVGLMLTSRDRGEGDHTDAHGNRWVDVGSGAWDKQGRPSEVRVDRLLQLRPTDVRREGGRIDEQTFSRVANATRDVFGW